MSFSQVTTASSGRWSSNGTWSNGVPNNNTTRVIIPQGVVVEIKNEQINLYNSSIELILEGPLIWKEQEMVKILLSCY